MREMNLQEVSSVSGGVIAIVNFTPHDCIDWGLAVFGGWHGGLAGASITTYVVVGVDIAKFGLGLAGGALGAITGFVLGKLFTTYVLSPIGDAISGSPSTS